MKIIKWLITIAVVGVIYWFGSDAISPYLKVSSLTPQYVYGDTVTFKIEVINFSPRPKEIHLAAADSTDVILLVDGANASKRLEKTEAANTVTIPPLSNASFTRTATLTPASGDKQPQVLIMDESVLAVTAGQHAVRASIGGHTSEPYTFGVR